MKSSVEAPTGAHTVQELIARRTAAEKGIAEVELPLLQRAAALLCGSAVKDFEAELSALAQQLGPGNSATMMGHALKALASLRQVIPQDVARHQHTKALP